MLSRRHAAAPAGACLLLTVALCALVSQTAAAQGRTLNQITCADDELPNDDGSGCHPRCPPGFDLKDGKCACPGEFFKPTEDGTGCELQCPSGLIPNSAKNGCKCPGGHLLDRGNHCSDKCPYGFVPDDLHERCVCPSKDLVPSEDGVGCELRCPKGMVLNYDGDGCDCPAGTVPGITGCRASTVSMEVADAVNPDAALMINMCPRGYVKDKEGECVCPYGRKDTGHGCVATTCPRGMGADSHGECICPDDQERNEDGRGCHLKCLPGYELNKAANKCVEVPKKCPKGMDKDKHGACVCPDDQVMNDDKTSCHLRCTEGFQLNKAGTKCVCPKGQVPKKNGEGCRPLPVSMANLISTNPNAALTSSMCPDTFVLSADDECVCPDDEELNDAGDKCQPACPSPFIYNHPLKMCICPDGSRRVTTSLGVDGCKKTDTEMSPPPVSCADDEYMSNSGDCKKCWAGSVPNAQKSGCIEAQSPPPYYSPRYPSPSPSPSPSLSPAESPKPCPTPPRGDGSCARNEMNFNGCCYVVCADGEVLDAEGRRCVLDGASPPPSWELINPPPMALPPPEDPPASPPAYSPPTYSSPTYSPPAYTPPPTDPPPMDVEPVASPPYYTPVGMDGYMGPDKSVQDTTSQQIEEDSSGSGLTAGVTGTVVAIVGLALVAMVASVFAYRSYTREAAAAAAAASERDSEPTSPAVTGLPPDVETPAHLAHAESMPVHGYPGYDHQDVRTPVGWSESHGYPGAASVAGMV